MQSQIKRWGNSAAVRLTSQLLADAKLDIKSNIEISVVDGKIIIESIDHSTKYLPFTEAELLKGLTPELAHADEIIQVTADEFGEIE